MSDPLVEKATQIVLAMASALLLHDSETVRELYDGINQSLRGKNTFPSVRITGTCNMTIRYE